MDQLVKMTETGFEPMLRVSSREHRAHRVVMPSGLMITEVQPRAKLQVPSPPNSMPSRTGSHQAAVHLVHGHPGWD